MKNRLIKNISYNFIYQLLILIIPFVTSPYLARVIGADGIGVYSYSYSIALYFTYFTVLGLNKYGNRVIAERQADFISRSKAFYEIYAMQFFAFFICAIVYTLYIIFLSQNKKIAIIQFLFVASGLFDINWFFFGMEQFKLTVIRNTVIKIATLICIFLFIKSETDVYKYTFIMSMGYLLSQICLWPFLRRFVSYEKVSLKNVFSHIKPNLILFVPVIAVSIYRIMDKIMLGSFCTMESVGFYESAERVINVPLALITALGTVMLPRITAMINNNQIVESRKYINKSMFLVMAFANGACFGIMAVSREFSLIYYGLGFEQAGIIMKYLAVTIVFFAVGDVVRTQFLIPNKRDKVYYVSALLGAGINLIINLILIPQYGAIGAAIGTICAEFSVCAYQIFHARKELDFKLYIKYECLYLISGVVMYLGLQINIFANTNIVTLLFKIVCGVVIYCISALICFKIFFKQNIFGYLRSK